MHLALLSLRVCAVPDSCFFTNESTCGPGRPANATFDSVHVHYKLTCQPPAMPRIYSRCFILRTLMYGLHSHAMVERSRGALSSLMITTLHHADEIQPGIKHMTKQNRLYEEWDQKRTCENTGVSQTSTRREVNPLPTGKGNLFMLKAFQCRCEKPC